MSSRHILQITEKIELRFAKQIFVSNHRIYFVQVHIKEENTHEERCNNTYMEDENWGLVRVGAFDIDGTAKPYHK